MFRLFLIVNYECSKHFKRKRECFSSYLLRWICCSLFSFHLSLHFSFAIYYNFFSLKRLRCLRHLHWAWRHCRKFITFCDIIFLYPEGWWIPDAQEESNDTQLLYFTVNLTAHFSVVVKLQNFEPFFLVRNVKFQKKNHSSTSRDAACNL